MRPFLSIVTRTYKRPTLLAKCVDSLNEQTDKDFEHIVLRDDAGVGIAETYRRLRTQDVCGQYVLVLDDDNMLTDVNFIANLKKMCLVTQPDVVFVQAKIGDRVLPDTPKPQLAHIDMMNVVVSQNVWNAHRKDFGARYEGDWDFIRAVSSNGFRSYRMPNIIGQTQRISRGQSEDFGLIGRTLVFKVGCAGIGFAYSEGEHIIVTQENADRLEGLYRAGHAEEFGVVQIPLPSEGSVKNRQRILIFCPTAPRIETETLDSIFGQTANVFLDFMFTRDNPYPPRNRQMYRNIHLNYEKMRKLVLSEKYDKVFIVESDMIVPKDALEKMLRVDASVVSGLYVLRHGSFIPNLMQYHEASKEIGSSMDWPVIMEKWGQTIPISGGCMGCLLVDAKVFEDFTFIVGHETSHDNALMRHCWQKGFKQMACLDVVCGHKKPDGVVLWPVNHGMGYGVENTQTKGAI